MIEHILDEQLDETLGRAPAGDYFVTPIGAAHLDDGLNFRVLGRSTIFTTSVVNLDSTLTIHTASGNNRQPAKLMENSGKCVS